MNVVVLKGRLSSDPQLRTLASGSALLSLEITTPADEGAASAPVAWFDPPETATFGCGDEVVVVGTVRRRFFRSPSGTQSRTEVVAREVVPAAKRAKVQRLLAAEAGRLGGGPDAALRSK